MEFELIAGPMRIESNSDGTFRQYAIREAPGGHKCKVVQYQIRVLRSSGTTFRLLLRMEHGPDGSMSVLHSTPIASTNPGATFPVTISGDSDSSLIVGEWIHPMLRANSSDASQSWAIVEVYELRKPF